MPATVPPGAEAFSRGGWPASARRSGRVRPGWLTAMVTEAQEQLHHGLVPQEPRVPCQRRHPMAAPPPPRSTHTPSSVPPTLHHIARVDLTDIARVLALYSQAVHQRLIGSSEAERLTFVALGLYSNKGTKTLIGCSQLTAIQGFSIFSQLVPFRLRLSWASRR